MSANTFLIKMTSKCNLNCLHCYDLKTNEDMSEDVLDKVIEYIKKCILNTNEEQYIINVVGGEISLYNQKMIKKLVSSFDLIRKTKSIKFIYQSNLIYEMSEETIETIKLFDEFGTSFDYSIRFRKEDDKKIWLNNLKLIQNVMENIRVTVTLTKLFIEHYTPTELIDFMLNLGIHNIEMNIMYPTVDGRNVKYLMPKNEDLREWLYKCFLYYHQKQKETKLTMMNLDCLENSFNGIFGWEHGRTCCEDTRTFLPNGKIATCILMQNKVFYDLNTNMELMPIEDLYAQEKQLNPMCYKCKYLNLCKGGCQVNPFDDTGCAIPYKVYDYLELKREMENNE